MWTCVAVELNGPDWGVGDGSDDDGDCEPKMNEVDVSWETWCAVCLS